MHDRQAVAVASEKHFISVLSVLFYMDVCFACMDVCTSCMAGAGGGPKRVSDSLELELLMVASCQVSAGN